MPGLFGAIGCPPGVGESLHRAFSAIWGSCESILLWDGVLGGHAFKGRSSVHQYEHGYFAVDGEASIYHAAASAPHRRLLDVSSQEPRAADDCRGNIALVDTSLRKSYLAADWAGSFPLYYAHWQGGLAFSSLLQPLARSLDAAVDPVGILQLVSRGYTFGQRTAYRNILRLLPGQVVAYESGESHSRVWETSRAWAVVREGPLADVTDELIPILKRAVQEGSRENARNALMMSAGWDSRTLLPFLLDQLGADRVVAYTHGDLQSRELRLVKNMCDFMGLTSIQEPIGPPMFEPDALNRGFQRVENALFPHWHHAAQVLDAAGVTCVAAGTYGEILGGHYGSPMVLRGARQFAVAAKLLMTRMGPAGWSSRRPSFDTTLDLLRIRRQDRPYFVAPEFWHGIDEPLAAQNDDIESYLRRLVARGVTPGEQLVEAFLAETRGTRFINMQILSCRGSVDVSLPYTDRNVLAIASGIPLASKFANSINRDVLSRVSPGLLKFATSATLVPANAPIAVQEASRFVRRIYQRHQRKLNLFSRGRIHSDRFGWRSLDLFRTTDVLMTLVDDLKSDIWDLPALRRQVLAYRNWDPAARWVYDHVPRIYTVDLLIRANPAPPFRIKGEREA